MSSAELVIGDVDLLSEILLRLPVKLLSRFKSVSKQWLSLISDTQFTLGYFLRQKNLPTVGLTFFSNDDGYRIIFHPLNSAVPADLSTSVSAPEFLSSPDAWILQSRNGLSLCSFKYRCSDDGDGNIGRKGCTDYLVCNFATNEFRVLPPCPGLGNSKVLENDMFFEFDPSKSPHYRIVSVSSDSMEASVVYKINIYSSETKSWTPGCTYSVPPQCSCLVNMDMLLQNGVLIYNLGGNVCLHTDVDKECVKTITIPRTFDVFWGKLMEYCGRTYLVDVRHSNLCLIYVYEMQMGQSGFLKHEGIKIDIKSFGVSSYRSLDVFGVIRDEDDDIVLVLAIDDVVYLLNPKKATLKLLLDLSGDDDCLFSWHPHIETLYRP